MMLRIVSVLILTLVVQHTFSQNQRYQIKYLEEKDGIKIYEGQPVTGIVYDVFDNGNMKYESHYKDGLMEGDFIRFFSNGNKYIQATFHTGDTVGVFKTRYKDEIIREEINFNEKGQRHGTQSRFYPDGTKRTVWVWEDGVCMEKWIYKEGKLMSRKKL